MDALRFLYCTAPDAATAGAIAEALVNERLAACVNILPSMESIYRWNDAIEHANETVLIVKTTSASAPAASARIAALHPYDTPAIAAIEVKQSGSNAAFLNWIAAQCR